MSIAAVGLYSVLENAVPTTLRCAPLPLVAVAGSQALCRA